MMSLKDFFIGVYMVLGLFCVTSYALEVIAEVGGLRALVVKAVEVGNK